VEISDGEQEIVHLARRPGEQLTRAGVYEENFLLAELDLSGQARVRKDLDGSDRPRGLLLDSRKKLAGSLAPGVLWKRTLEQAPLEKNA
jgi:hypothetical protein